MNAVTLPTARDEAWRYADFKALEGLKAADFDVWREITVPAGETVQETVLLDGDALHLTRLRVTVGEGGRFELFAVNAGNAYARLEADVTLAAHSHFEFGGVTIGGGAEVREFVTRTRHVAPDATSNQTVRSVHWGKATGNFLGRIDVAREGQRTDAAQDFKALILEKGASANAKPELEIFADDVKCAHGAAIGQMDETARFYMASRGLSPEAAKKLLIRAFIADALGGLTHDDEKERLLNAALSILEEKP